MDKGQQWKDQLPDPGPGGLTGLKNAGKEAADEIISLLGYGSRAVTGIPGVKEGFKKVLGDKPKTFNGTTMYNPKQGVKAWAKDAAVTAGMLYGAKGGKPAVGKVKPFKEPAVKPAEKPVEKPAETTAEKPVEKQTAKTRTSKVLKAAGTGAVVSSLLNTGDGKGDKPWTPSGIV